MRAPRLRLLLAAGVLATAAAVMFATSAGADSITFPSPVSPNGQRINELYLLISIPAILIFLGVEIWILLVIFRYRRSRQPVGYAPPQWHGNRLIEVVWTLIPLAIVLTIAGLSFLELQRDFVRPSDAATQMDVTVTAYQFGWEYDYPKQGIKTTNKLVVPVGQLVRLRFETRDVIHSWWVPSISGKTDAVPGYDNYGWLQIGETGTWKGQCAELCGQGHALMTTEVQAMSASDFQDWVQQQKSKSTSSSSSSSSSSSGSSSSSSSSTTSSTSGSSSSP
jgi:cytochrome c oxidase subunit 2